MSFRTIAFWNQTLTLIKGAAEWPKLSWSRPVWYPFAQTSLRMSKVLNFILPLAFFGRIYMTATFANMGYMSFYYESRIDLCVLYVLAYFSAYKVRYKLAEIEHRFFRRLINNRLQIIWAESFRNTTEQEYSPPNQGYTFLLVRVGLFYATIFSVSAATTALAFRAFERLVPWEISSGSGLLIYFFLFNPPTSIGFCIVKTLAICVFLDLLVRLGAVIYFDPLGLWRKTKPQTRQESGNSRYAWVTSSLRIFLPVVIGGFWAIFVSLFLDTRRATHKEYRFGVVPFILGNIILVIGAILVIKYLYWAGIMRAMVFVRRDPKTALQRTGMAFRKWWTGQPDREIQL